MSATEIKALTFDVFGTVVDYYSSIVSEGEQLAQQKGLQIDWGAFALVWRTRYNPFIQRVERHELPWTKLDTLHFFALEEVLNEFHITTLTEQEKLHLNRVWHRLQPWPDSVAGLTRLRQKYILATLSNGNVALLTNMAKYSALPWDCILSAELVKAYKPNPAVYEMAIELLELPPGSRPQTGLCSSPPRIRTRRHQSRLCFQAKLRPGCSRSHRSCPPTWCINLSIPKCDGVGFELALYHLC